MREASFWEARSFWVSPVIGLSPSGMGMEKRSPERARFSKSSLDVCCQVHAHNSLMRP
jgi:hypothetical protein